MKRHFRLPTLSVVVVFAILAAFAPPSLSDIPKVINYQGKVTDSGGGHVPDGTYDMAFSIWNSESGGYAPLWISGTHNVQVTDGIFSVLLGTVGLAPLDLEFNVDLWLEVTIEGDVQSPRQHFGSVGYAYMASGLVPGTEVSGDVGIGAMAAFKGTNTSTVAQTAGVMGEATGSVGGTSGIMGTSASMSGRGVYGLASATTGTNYGVVGVTNSADGYAGYFTGNCYVTGGRVGIDGIYTDYRLYVGGGSLDGIYATTSSSGGAAIYGHASGTTFSGYGVHGKSDGDLGRGVVGVASGVSGRGIYGEANASAGETYGGYFESSTNVGYGAKGVALGDDYAVGLWGLGNANATTHYGVYYSGGLGGTGSKSCVVMTSRGPTLLYCQESPENWFEDFGEGQLVNGQAHIDLDPLFLETITIDDVNPMKVFVELHDENCNGVAVRKGQTGFDVVERHGGSSNGTFDYRVVAKRKGFEDKRLDYCKAAENDSYLYPKLKEKELHRLEAERARTEEQRRRMEHERNRHEGTRAARAMARKPMAEVTLPPLD